MSNGDSGESLIENGNPIKGGNGRIQQLDIQDEMRNSYLTYAMSVIISRALPDARDGLKPSQRRILVAMNDLNLGPNSAGSSAQDHRRHQRELPPPRQRGALSHAGALGPGLGDALGVGR